MKKPEKYKKIYYFSRKQGKKHSLLWSLRILVAEMLPSSRPNSIFSRSLCNKVIYSTSDMQNQGKYIPPLLICLLL